MPQWSLLFWFSLLVVGFVGSFGGVLLCNFVPGGRARERFTWYPKSGGAAGTLLSIVPAVFFLPNGSTFSLFLITFSTGLIVSYLSSRLPRINQFLEKPAPPRPDPPAERKAKAMYFRKDWNVRPRYETEEDGQFVGRTEFLERLNSHFISRSGGTILISGVRGVGKTALVDRALVTSRRKLQNRYWKQTWKHLEQARPWHFIDLKVRRTLLEKEGHTSIDTADYLTLKKGAEHYSAEPPRWWSRFDPVDRRIRQMHEASRWQLFVLKFSASDISGALPDPGQQIIGRPRINPEKLMRSIIRKLYITFDASRAEPEASVLQWSLRNKAKRQLFFDTLNAAYKKSISKSYKEIISNTINDLLKQTQATTWEGKLSAEKIAIVLICVAACIAFSLFGWSRAWVPLQYLQTLGIPAAIGGYILLSWGFKRTREKSFDQSRQSSFSFEYDYSLHQMRQDLESLVRTLSPPHDEDADTHDRYRCFRRTIVIFDELDKLEQADQQLDDIITHFKNFFTLSEAVFVFLTDHEFYEHLTRETVKAQLARHYPPQHTFFTEKIYLRKPEFARFREAFFRFTDNAWIEQHTRSLPADAMLVDDILKRDETNVSVIEQLPLETLTQLYVQRRQYKAEQTKAIEREFERQKGKSDPMALAQIWASEAARVVRAGEERRDFQEMRKSFHAAEGWKNSAAVSFLYHRRDDFSDTDKNTIDRNFRKLEVNSLSRYNGVDAAPFTLSDLARALCFQTRNHYFDLYTGVYDYVASYEDGAPVLVLDEGRYAHEPKLWSRYQQLLEIAFDSARENHPSREYFNALLMESLYRAFDRRRNGANVKIGEVLFPPRDELAAVAKTLLAEEVTTSVAVTPIVETESENFQQTLIRLVKLASDKLTAPQTPSQQNGDKIQVQPYTDRDADKINQAIIRLLQLALAHNAIREVTPNLKSLLKDDVKPLSLADVEFAWNDDSCSVIRSVVREQHEQDLINFWQQERSELESFDLELADLWSTVPIAGESSRIHEAISELKSRADKVGLGQGTISGPDASALKANVGTWDSREALWSRVILDRIRKEDDAEVTEEFDKPLADVVPTPASNVRPGFEAATALKVTAIIRPRNTACAIYLVVSQLPATEVNLATAKTALPANTSLFWYVTGKEAPDFKSPVPEGINIYASPLTGAQPPVEGAGRLISDYVAFTSKQRLDAILTHLQAAQYKDALLAQRAGAEVLGPIVSGAGLFEAESHLNLAIQLLKEKRERFATAGFADWTDLAGGWSPSYAAKRIAAEIVEKGQLPPAFSDVIEQSVSELFGTNADKLTPEAWLKAFLASTEERNAISYMLLKTQIRQFMRAKMDSAKMTDQALRSAIEEHFVPWLASSVQAGEQTVGAKTGDPASIIALTQELERQRQNLRMTPLPSTPGAPRPSTPSKSSRKRAS
jgi:hypothetical protein